MFLAAICFLQLNLPDLYVLTRDSTWCMVNCDGWRMIHIYMAWNDIQRDLLFIAKTEADLYSFRLCPCWTSVSCDSWKMLRIYIVWSSTLCFGWRMLQVYISWCRIRYDGCKMTDLYSLTRWPVRSSVDCDCWMMLSILRIRHDTKLDVVFVAMTGGCCKFIWLDTTQFDFVMIAIASGSFRYILLDPTPSIF